jgi:nucleoside-triphosphatase THEP1
MDVLCKETRVFLETEMPSDIPPDSGMELKRSEKAMIPVKTLPGDPLASLISPPKNKPRLLFVSGPKGSGKTLWCMELIRHAQAQGLRVSGLISPSIFENGKKVGIGLWNLQTGEQRRLAYLKGAEAGDIQTQNWQMLAATMEWGNSVFAEIDPCDLFVLDEIGPFEMEHGVGFVDGLKIIDTAQDFPCVAVIRPSLINEARKRWKWAEVLDLSTGAIL